MEATEVKTKELICIGCPKGCRIEVKMEGEKIRSLSGYECRQGRDYAREESVNPTRILTTTVWVEGGELVLVPVKTEGPIPRGLIDRAMRRLARVSVQAPVSVGDVVVEDLLGTGTDVLATRSVGRSTGEESRRKLA